MGEEEAIALDEFGKFEQKLARKEAKKDTKLASFLVHFFLSQSFLAEWHSICLCDVHKVRNETIQPFRRDIYTKGPLHDRTLA
jgi:hypothetical protein